VVRGFAHEKDRKKETIEAITKISQWRELVNYYNFFNEMHPLAKDFHDWWPEYIYGVDGWGHMLQGVRMSEIDSDALARMPDGAIDQIQGQKMKAYAVYKQDMSACSGRQRYKHTLLVDLTGVTMNMMMGDKKKVLQKIFALGSNYFPETIWQIYLINSPMVFRAIWSAVKQFLHPLTVNKIQIIGSYKEALKKMTAANIPAASLPQWMGGKHPGMKTFDYIQQLVSEKRQHSSLKVSLEGAESRAQGQGAAGAALREGDSDLSDSTASSAATVLAPSV